MKRSNCTMFGIIALILAASVGTALAQSTNRDNPTSITSNEVSGSFRDPDEGTKEYFYSFTAGPGELTLTVDLKGHDRDSSGSMAYEVLKGNGSEDGPLLCCEYAQMGGGATGRSVASVKLTRRQTVVLHLTNSMYRGGTFNIRFSGTAISSGGTHNTGGSGDLNTGDRDRVNDGNGHIDVPDSGTLHIKMKNGTTQDINLSRVRSISVRP